MGNNRGEGKPSPRQSQSQRAPQIPGANDRNSAPEHLWNGARWWSDAFGEFDRPIAGRYVIRDPHCSVLGPGEL